MIKVTLGDNTKPVDVKPFPKLMVGSYGQESGTIVLFFESGIGTVIKGVGFYEEKEGEYSTAWKMDWFEDYNFPLTIQNA